MLDNIYIVTDLGPGDGGKGGVVHALAVRKDASVIIKRGGAQGSHGVRTSAQESFNFSQWGCGTLNGIPTYCSEQMVLSPVGLKNESEALKRTGIYDPFALLSVDPDCICATPIHTVSSKLEELLRGKNPRGTIGTGVGQAYRMSETMDDDMTIRASELTDRKTIENKLLKQRDCYRERYANITADNGIPEDKPLMEENLCLLEDDDFITYILDEFTAVGEKLRFAELTSVLSQNGTAIVECSHGVLTDAVEGLKPHVSAIRTLPSFTEQMFRSAGYSGKIFNLAVHRAYEIRHGAGPMPTYDPEFTEKMLPGSHKDENRWQGIIRAGALDINLLRYAVNSCRNTRFDGLCLTWFDQILRTDRNWRICSDYKAIKPTPNIIEFLTSVQPIVTDHIIEKPISSKDLVDFVNRTLQPYIGIPTYMLSVGPTEKDKIIREMKEFA